MTHGVNTVRLALRAMLPVKEAQEGVVLTPSISVGWLTTAKIVVLFFGNLYQYGSLMYV